MIEKDFRPLLGGVKRDGNGKIISARAIEFKIIGYMNGTAAKLQRIHSDSAIGDYVSNRKLRPYSIGGLVASILMAELLLK